MHIQTDYSTNLYSLGVVLLNMKQIRIKIVGNNKGTQNVDRSIKI